MTEHSAHHVGITVEDLEDILPFYRDRLGLDVLDRFSVEGEDFADAVGVDGAGASFVHLDANGVRLELVEYDPEADPRPTPGLNEPGATHVGLAVADLDAFYADLPDEVPTISEPRTTESGTSICFLRDPEGNLVEILEP
ncbi:VOC family protein [Natronococcus occultus]|uniref:Lactoylglutathione lyase-like lyase n=1 Tax=Natronococcus occultus SP4 TaxID=694430 RepID=L0K3U6_9EURY|nr:VOC family protein [Natronococcus occultus]AGB39225.1 lactoylglutathione lyase-like lyase [Natronococcus occultus SP4]